MKTVIRCLLGATILQLACGSAKTAVPFRQLDSTNGETPAAFKSTVKDHAVYGALMRDGIARGDLDAAHRAAHALVQLVTETERPVPRSRIGDTVDAAARVEAAQDIPAAAREFAVLSQSCGACHTAFGGPRSFPAEPPPDAVAVGPRMRRHQWGAARLWEGLVAPSNEAWKSGAETLSDAPLNFESELGKGPRPEIDKLTTTVHELGVTAASAASASVRVDVYGKLLTTCADCHRQTGGGPNGPAH